MKNTHWLVCLSLALGLSIGIGPSHAQRDEMPPGYPQSLEADLHFLVNQLRAGKPSPELLVQLSSTYFDLADDLLTDDNRRREAYLAGAKAAEEALSLNDNNADAHFFHAVNLGSAGRLQGIANAAMVVKEMKRCAMRAIELNPQHAQALQLMGALLIELPWVLGGDEKKAQKYLERAIAADGNYTKARILVATLYRKQGRIADAITQLEAVIHADKPHYRYAWERQYKPEAERLLHELTHR